MGYFGVEIHSERIKLRGRSRQHPVFFVSNKFKGLLAYFL
jgi:hypothetical protein